MSMPIRFWSIVICFVCQLPFPVQAADNLPFDIDPQWGGHLKLSGRSLDPQRGSAFDDVGLDTKYDYFAEFRLNSKTILGDSTYIEIHWEGLLGGGEAREDGEALKELYPALFHKGIVYSPNDDRRFFDMTAVVHEDDDTLRYHRLDRAMAVFSPSWGEVRLGRQAITWGHGFTFNPMDLFNPFAPTDLERDYKSGDDMALVQVPFNGFDLEVISVFRRDPLTGDKGLDQNSLAAMLHFTVGDKNIDIMAARHFEDLVFGAGAVGYLGQAAWRFDVTGTSLDRASRGRSSYLSAVANLDYSWVWLDKNWYGYIELYYNGLSDNDYQDQFTDAAISDRIDRGELFALGRLYWSGQINLELHPLINLYLTSIVNLDDPSGIWLPRVVYDVSDDFRLTLQGAFNWGGSDTEYGGYDLPGYSFKHKSSDSILASLTWYF